MDRIGSVSRSYRNAGSARAERNRGAKAREDSGALRDPERREEAAAGRELAEQPGGWQKEKEKTGRQQEKQDKDSTEKMSLEEQQDAARQSVQDWLEKRQKKKEEEARGYGLVSQLQARAEAVKKAFDPKRKKNLYDATLDLTLLEQIEKIPSLRAMHSRLAFKIRAVKASGASQSEIRIAVSKLKKVVGKVRAKIRGLEKEELLERRRKNAEEAKRRTKEEALRREKELLKKLRKAKERRDIEESKMGMGANYGGPGEDSALEFVMDAYGGSVSADTGAVIDMAVSAETAVADAGAAAADVGGAVDVGV